jgi:hypothetical protein
LKAKEKMKKGMNEKKDKKSCFYNNPEMAEYNCKHEKEVNIVNTIDYKI